MGDLRADSAPAAVLGRIGQVDAVSGMGELEARPSQ